MPPAPRAPVHGPVRRPVRRPGGRLSIVAFDADDTLWHTERAFRLTQGRFRDLLADHAAPGHLDARLLAAERANLGLYGYGVKAFVLSMIETALEVTEARVPGHVIAEIVDAGREMLAHPVELLPGAAEAVAHAAEGRTAMIVTKGDLLDQERKIAASGLGDLVSRVEIVSEKSAATYRGLFAEEGALMVGDSLRSDILPSLEAGAWAAHVPHAGEPWALERAEAPTAHPRYARLDGIGAVPALIDAIDARLCVSGAPPA